jgi:hypothetical protein
LAIERHAASLHNRYQVNAPKDPKQAHSYLELSHTSHVSNDDGQGFATLASLLFLLPAIEGPVKLAAVPILPEPVAAATDEGEPKKKQPLTPATAAARGVERPNAARAAVYEAILAAAGAKSEATPAVAAAPTEKPDAPATPPAPAPEEDDGLGKVEDLLKPAP